MAGKIVKRVRLKDLAREIGINIDLRQRAYIDAVVKACVETIPELVKNSPVDQGFYAQSWDVSRDPQSVVLGNFAPHAPIIEFGARPFVCPLKPLLAWAKRVLQDPSQPPNYSPAVWRLARYTQKKIASVGIAPKHVLENEIPRLLDRVKSELSKIA